MVKQKKLRSQISFKLRKIRVYIFIVVNKTIKE